MFIHVNIHTWCARLNTNIHIHAPHCNAFTSMFEHKYIFLFIHVNIHTWCALPEHHTYTCMYMFVSLCIAECCSVLQCVAVCCSVLQCVAVCCSMLQCTSHMYIYLNVCVFCMVFSLLIRSENRACPIFWYCSAVHFIVQQSTIRYKGLALYSGVYICFYTHIHIYIYVYISIYVYTTRYKGLALCSGIVARFWY